MASRNACPCSGTADVALLPAVPSPGFEPAAAASIFSLLAAGSSTNSDEAAGPCLAGMLCAPRVPSAFARRALLAESSAATFDPDDKGADEEEEEEERDSFDSSPPAPVPRCARARNRGGDCDGDGWGWEGGEEDGDSGDANIVDDPEGSCGAPNSGSSAVLRGLERRDCGDTSWLPVSTGECDGERVRLALLRPLSLWLCRPP